MNRKNVNGSKENEATVHKQKNECDSNSTDSFDMKDFKSSSLAKKYSVQIHKNNADLMAELDNINIMGDESDVEIIDPKAEQNGLSIRLSDANSSKVISLNTTQSSDDRANGDFENDKHKRVLAWAQSQSQNLSMCVASVLSDHDYLSQELLLGIIASNEENHEMECQRELNGENGHSEIESNEQNGYTNKVETTTTTIQSGEAMQTLNSNNINDFNCILKLLTDSKERAQSLKLLQQIEEKAKQMKAQLGGDVQIGKDGETVENNSNETSPEFSPNHSEPLEYYGGIKFSTQNSIDEAKESEGSYIF